jgi:hypothetical protein
MIYWTGNPDFTLTMAVHCPNKAIAQSAIYKDNALF